MVFLGVGLRSLVLRLRANVSALDALAAATRFLHGRHGVLIGIEVVASCGRGISYDRPRLALVLHVARDLDRVAALLLSCLRGVVDLIVRASLYLTVVELRDG